MTKEITHKSLILSGEELVSDSSAVFGFWVYLMTDLVLFASLFAVYAVLRGNVFGGPSASQIFNMPQALAETLLLLASSFTCGLSMLAASKEKKQQVVGWLLMTFVLGATFVGLEFSEFGRLVIAGDGPARSGFLSAYFGLVGAHGLHITLGLLWAAVLMWAIVARGLTRFTMRKLALFSLFWHFLEIVWIFIFCLVYLMGIVI